MTKRGQELDTSRIERALDNIKQFVKRAKALIEEIKPEHLTEEGGLNPYMTAALGVSTIEDAVRLFVYRRVERSLGTSFGNVIEAFLRDLLGGISGKDVSDKCRSRQNKGKRPWICWWDIVIQKEFKEGEKRYKGIVLAVKSGPADLNKDIIERFIQHAIEAEEQGYRPYLVLTYGKQAFTVARSTLNSWGLDPERYILVGRDIFRVFLGDSRYYEYVIDLIRATSRGVDIFELMERKVEELTRELKKKYKDVDSLLKDLS